MVIVQNIKICRENTFVATECWQFREKTRVIEMVVFCIEVIKFFILEKMHIYKHMKKKQ